MYSFLSLLPPSQIPNPKNQIKIKISLYLFKNNWLFMMLNPNEWSKGSHFIRCYLKPKVSMAETQVIEAPWLHYKPAWPNLQELTHHRWWSSPLPLFLFSVYFFVYGWKSSTFVWLVVGWEFGILFEDLKNGGSCFGHGFFFKINLFVGFG